MSTGYQRSGMYYSAPNVVKSSTLSSNAPAIDYWAFYNGSYGAMSGSVPPAVSGLPSLASLELIGASLSGTLPSELWSLTALRRLSLNSNPQLSGYTPTALGSPSVLTRVDLFSTRVCGGWAAFNTTNFTFGWNLNPSVPNC